MPAVHADLAVSARWILPMTHAGAVLEDHAVIVRDGRIVDLLAAPLALERYAATVHVRRPEHLLMPGLVNAHTRIAPPPGWRARRERLHDGALLCIAALLKSGTTSFCGLGDFPDVAARTAAEQGLRAVIGMPIAQRAGPWAGSPAEYLTRALSLRDEYRGHPSIATIFAPQRPGDIGDDSFGRIAMLVDELDAGLVMTLHESRHEVTESLQRYGLRPLERMHALGLLTPSLLAAHMTAIDEADLALAQRGGIAIACCPESGLRRGHGMTPVAAWSATGLRLAVGGGADDPDAGLDVWGEAKMLALLSMPPAAALAAATRGGAAALGLDAEVGTLEHGKWADLCCIDLGGPALRWCAAGGVSDSAARLALHGGRDAVSDVWVAGRHLVAHGGFTRLDWQDLAARVDSWREPSITGGCS